MSKKVLLGLRIFMQIRPNPSPISPTSPLKDAIICVGGEPVDGDVWATMDGEQLKRDSKHHARTLGAELALSVEGSDVVVFHNGSLSLLENLTHESSHDGPRDDEKGSRSSRKRATVVTPQWLKECVDSGARVDTAPFEIQLVYDSAGEHEKSNKMHLNLSSSNKKHGELSSSAKRKEDAATADSRLTVGQQKEKTLSQQSEGKVSKKTKILESKEEQEDEARKLFASQPNANAKAPEGEEANKQEHQAAVQSSSEPVSAEEGAYSAHSPRRSYQATLILTGGSPQQQQQQQQQGGPLALAEDNKNKIDKACQRSTSSENHDINTTEITNKSEEGQQRARTSQSAQHSLQDDLEFEEQSHDKVNLNLFRDGSQERRKTRPLIDELMNAPETTAVAASSGILSPESKKRAASPQTNLLSSIQLIHQVSSGNLGAVDTPRLDGKVVGFGQNKTHLSNVTKTTPNTTLISEDATNDVLAQRTSLLTPLLGETKIVVTDDKTARVEMRPHNPQTHAKSDGGNAEKDLSELPSKAVTPTKTDAAGLRSAPAPVVEDPFQKRSAPHTTNKTPTAIASAPPVNNLAAIYEGLQQIASAGAVSPVKRRESEAIFVRSETEVREQGSEEAAKSEALLPFPAAQDLVHSPPSSSPPLGASSTSTQVFNPNVSNPNSAKLQRIAVADKEGMSGGAAGVVVPLDSQTVAVVPHPPIPPPLPVVGGVKASTCSDIASSIGNVYRQTISSQMFSSFATTLADGENSVNISVVGNAHQNNTFYTAPSSFPQRSDADQSAIKGESSPDDPNVASGTCVSGTENFSRKSSSRSNADNNTNDDNANMFAPPQQKATSSGPAPPAQSPSSVPFLGAHDDSQPGAFELFAAQDRAAPSDTNMSDDSLKLKGLHLAQSTHTFTGTSSAGSEPHLRGVAVGRNSGSALLDSNGSLFSSSNFKNVEDQNTSPFINSGSVAAGTRILQTPSHRGSQPHQPPSPAARLVHAIQLASCALAEAKTTPIPLSLSVDADRNDNNNDTGALSSQPHSSHHISQQTQYGAKPQSSHQPHAPRSSISMDPPSSLFASSSSSNLPAAPLSQQEDEEESISRTRKSLYPHYDNNENEFEGNKNKVKQNTNNCSAATTAERPFLPSSCVQELTFGLSSQTAASSSVSVARHHSGSQQAKAEASAEQDRLEPFFATQSVVPRGEDTNHLDEVDDGRTYYSSAAFLLGNNSVMTEQNEDDVFAKFPSLSVLFSQQTPSVTQEEENFSPTAATIPLLSDVSSSSANTTPSLTPELSSQHQLLSQTNNGGAFEPPRTQEKKRVHPLAGSSEDLLLTRQLMNFTHNLDAMKNKLMGTATTYPLSSANYGGSPAGKVRLTARNTLLEDATAVKMMPTSVEPVAVATQRLMMTRRAHQEQEALREQENKGLLGGRGGEAEQQRKIGGEEGMISPRRKITISDEAPMIMPTQALGPRRSPKRLVASSSLTGNNTSYVASQKGHGSEREIEEQDEPICATVKENVLFEGDIIPTVNDIVTVKSALKANGPEKGTASVVRGEVSVKGRAKSAGGKLGSKRARERSSSSSSSSSSSDGSSMDEIDEIVALISGSSTSLTAGDAEDSAFNKAAPKRTRGARKSKTSAADCEAEESSAGRGANNNKLKSAEIKQEDEKAKRNMATRSSVAEAIKIQRFADPQPTLVSLSGSGDGKDVLAGIFEGRGVEVEARVFGRNNRTSHVVLLDDYLGAQNTTNSSSAISAPEELRGRRQLGVPDDNQPKVTPKVLFALASGTPLLKKEWGLRCLDFSKFPSYVSVREVDLQAQHDGRLTSSSSARASFLFTPPVHELYEYVHTLQRPLAHLYEAFLAENLALRSTLASSGAAVPAYSPSTVGKDGLPLSMSSSAAPSGTSLGTASSGTLPAVSSYDSPAVTPPLPLPNQRDFGRRVKAVREMLVKVVEQYEENEKQHHNQEGGVGGVGTAAATQRSLDVLVQQLALILSIGEEEAGGVENGSRGEIVEQQLFANEDDDGDNDNVEENGQYRNKEGLSGTTDLKRRLMSLPLPLALHVVYATATPFFQLATATIHKKEDEIYSPIDHTIKFLALAHKNFSNLSKKVIEVMSGGKASPGSGTRGRGRGRGGGSANSANRRKGGRRTEEGEAAEEETAAGGGLEWENEEKGEESASPRGSGSMNTTSHTLHQLQLSVSPLDCLLKNPQLTEKLYSTLRRFYLASVFDGMRFYLLGTQSCPTNAQLSELIGYLGGTVVRTMTADPLTIVLDVDGGVALSHMANQTLQQIKSPSPQRQKAAGTINSNSIHVPSLKARGGKGKITEGDASCTQQENEDDDAAAVPPRTPSGSKSGGGQRSDSSTMASSSVKKKRGRPPTVSSAAAESSSASKKKQSGGTKPAAVTATLLATPQRTPQLSAPELERLTFFSSFPYCDFLVSHRWLIDVIVEQRLLDFRLPQYLVMARGDFGRCTSNDHAEAEEDLEMMTSRRPEKEVDSDEDEQERRGGENREASSSLQKKKVESKTQQQKQHLSTNSRVFGKDEGGTLGEEDNSAVSQSLLVLAQPSSPASNPLVSVAAESPPAKVMDFSNTAALDREDQSNPTFAKGGKDLKEVYHAAATKATVAEEAGGNRSASGSVVAGSTCAFSPSREQKNSKSPYSSHPPLPPSTANSPSTAVELRRGGKGDKSPSTATVVPCSMLLSNANTPSSSATKTIHDIGETPTAHAIGSYQSICNYYSPFANNSSSSTIVAMGGGATPTLLAPPSLHSNVNEDDTTAASAGAAPICFFSNETYEIVPSLPPSAAGGIVSSSGTSPADAPRSCPYFDGTSDDGRGRVESEENENEEHQQQVSAEENEEVEGRGNNSLFLKDNGQDDERLQYESHTDEQPREKEEREEKKLLSHTAIEESKRSLSSSPSSASSPSSQQSSCTSPRSNATEISHHSSTPLSAGVMAKALLPSLPLPPNDGGNRRLSLVTAAESFASPKAHDPLWRGQGQGAPLKESNTPSSSVTRKPPPGMNTSKKRMAAVKQPQLQYDTQQLAADDANSNASLLSCASTSSASCMGLRSNGPQSTIGNYSLLADAPHDRKRSRSPPSSEASSSGTSETDRRGFSSRRGPHRAKL